MTSERDEFIGGYVTYQTKAALREEAEKQDRSVSWLLSCIINEYLKSKGYDVDEQAQ